MYASVLVEYSVKSLDKTFTYKIPSQFESLLKVGNKVKIEFNHKLINGFVMKITNDYDASYELKEIKAILNPEFCLNEELLELGNYMSKEVLCSKIVAYEAMLPSSYKINSDKTFNLYDTFISLKISKEEANKYLLNNKRNSKQIEIINYLLVNNKCLKKDYQSTSLNLLIKKGIIKEEKVLKYRLNNRKIINNKIVLNDMQTKVFQKVNLDTFKTYLLYGVTGSGKTEIYLNLIEETIKKGKTAIMLAPEISLTMQIVNRFYERFGQKVAIFHSALSDGERHDEYLKIINKEVSIVVGTRSAIFAPLDNLGIIIIDEEQSDSYKQDNNPRYNAKDMALFRCQYHNIPLLLGSATPSLEAMARASKGVYELLILDKRVGNSSLPEVTLVNMENEYKKKNFVFSDLLLKEIKLRIKNNEQIILLLNRRGYATFINCSNCGYTYKCPHCDISLIYHKSSNNLLCHYCGYQVKKSELCPNCHEKGLNYLGMGTEKLESELLKLVPDAKIIRMDQDTTVRKGSHERIINEFKKGNYNILLGTQVVSKGLDFPNVTLVGVINADNSLNIPDFRSNENTFDLLNQVSGRAGRRDTLGKVIIQTFNPDNYILKCVQNNNYKAFYLYEMQFRKTLKYPPYYYLTSIKVISKDYEKALNNAKLIANYLKNNLNEKTIILGPTTASLLKYNNLYRFQLIIKYQKDDSLIKVLKELDNQYILNKDINIEIDINPIRI